MTAGAHDADAMLSLAAVLDCLAGIFSRPDGAARTRAEALLLDPRLERPELAEIVRPLREIAAADDADLGTEFVRLFQHGSPATAHPFESFYRTGYLMDAACLRELNALFASAGVRPREEDAFAPDHLAVELEFLSLLLRGAATSDGGSAGRRAVRRIASELLRDHLLPFSQAFRARLDLLRPGSTYAAASAALAATLTTAGRRLSSSAAGETPAEPA